MRIEQGNNWTMYHADCLDVLAEIARVDVVVTDPPYGVGLGDTQGTGGKHGLTRAGYATYEDTYENFVGLIVPRLAAFLAIANRGGVFTGPHIQEQPKATAIGGVYCPAGSGRHAWGFKTFLPVLFYGTAPDLHNGARPTVLYSTAVAEKNGHPCPKPIRWMTWLVDLVSRPGETVLDPFAGSGTTGVACLRLRRPFVGVEIDAAYFDLACRTLETEAAQLHLPLAL